MAGNRQWAGTTFGSGWMHSRLIGLLRHVDVRVLYVFVDIFVIPFCLIFNRSRSTAYHFFRERMGYGVWKSVWSTVVNHCNFAQVVIDRFAMYAGQKFDVIVEGMEHFNALAAGDEGFIHLSSHIGNYEIAGYSLVSDSKTINAVVYAHEKASVMENRNSMFVKTNIRMIPMDSDLQYLFDIDNALSNGDIVSFPSDRYMEGSRCLEAGFLGGKAHFPQGPFRVAAMRGVDVLAVNVMKEGSKRYRIYVTPIPYDRTAPRAAQVNAILEGYVAELEKRVRQYPEQWYNFFDFWK